jgi:hypothetical protein
MFKRYVLDEQENFTEPLEEVWDMDKQSF